MRCTMMMNENKSLEETIERLNESMASFIREHITQNEKIVVQQSWEGWEAGDEEVDARFLKGGVVGIKFQEEVCANMLEAINALPSESLHYFSLDFGGLKMGNENAQQLLELLIKKKIKLAYLNLDHNEITDKSIKSVCDFILNTGIIALSLQASTFSITGKPCLSEDGCQKVCKAAIESKSLLYINLEGNSDYYDDVLDVKRHLEPKRQALEAQLKQDNQLNTDEPKVSLSRGAKI